MFLPGSSVTAYCENDLKRDTEHLRYLARALQCAMEPAVHLATTSFFATLLPMPVKLDETVSEDPVCCF